MSINTVWCRAERELKEFRNIHISLGSSPPILGQGQTVAELASTAKSVEDAYRLLRHIAQYSWGHEKYEGFGESTDVKAYEVDSDGDFPYTVEDASLSGENELVIDNREIRVLDEEDP